MTWRGALASSVLLHGLLGWLWLPHSVNSPVAQSSALAVSLQAPAVAAPQSNPALVPAHAVALHKAVAPVMTQTKAAAAVMSQQTPIKSIAMPSLAAEPAKVPVTESAAEPVAENIGNSSKATQTSSNEQKVTPAQYRAAYLQNPKPEMPYLSKMKGESGRVGLRVKVGIHGEPLAVRIEQSSGFARLDAAAYQTVLEKWRFVPARVGDTPIEGEVAFGIPFILISE